MAETSSDTIVRLPIPPPIEPEQWLSPVQWGMVSFLLSEVAFFSTLIATYLSFLGQEQSGPTPAVLELPLVIGTTICLMSSSVTVHLAEQAGPRDEPGWYLLALHPVLPLCPGRTCQHPLPRPHSSRRV